jgi:hypothetical protein
MPGITCSRFATVFALSLVGGLVLLAPGQSWTQEKHKLSWSARPENTKFTFQHTLEILDVPGHAIRMFEIRRTWPENPPTIEGLKVVEEIARGTTDSVAGNGRSWGYSSWRYEERRLELRRMAEHQPGSDKPRWKQEGHVCGHIPNDWRNWQVAGAQGIREVHGSRRVRARRKGYSERILSGGRILGREVKGRLRKHGR